jgi:hypothetical protein
MKIYSNRKQLQNAFGKFLVPKPNLETNQLKTRKTDLAKGVFGL